MQYLDGIILENSLGVERVMQLSTIYVLEDYVLWAYNLIPTFLICLW